MYSRTNCRSIGLRFAPHPFCVVVFKSSGLTGGGRGTRAGRDLDARCAVAGFTTFFSTARVDFLDLTVGVRFVAMPLTLKGATGQVKAPKSRARPALLRFRTAPPLRLRPKSALHGQDLLRIRKRARSNAGAASRMGGATQKIRCVAGAKPVAAGAHELFATQYLFFELSQRERVKYI